jgi:magnesium chelatase subunit I
MNDVIEPLQTLPYEQIVGQEAVKTALELCFVEPRLGGVLISGERGTGKSTTVRAFAQMAYGASPVTLPINATEDRVVGGLDLSEVIAGKWLKKDGLLKEADGKLLYIDEVNLLDDHIVNIILDVTSTGRLVVQREGLRDEYQVRFSLVGTMNPEEGSLRPQLLDRFGLVVNVEKAKEATERRNILKNVLAASRVSPETASRSRDVATREKLENARLAAATTPMDDEVLDACVRIASKFDVEGHRAELAMALAARALAALRGERAATIEHVRKIAPMALGHRRKSPATRSPWAWNDHDIETLESAFPRA